jgi:hypothetical protein
MRRKKIMFERRYPLFVNVPNFGPLSNQYAAVVAGHKDAKILYIILSPLKRLNNRWSKCEEERWKKNVREATKEDLSLLYKNQLNNYAAFLFWNPILNFTKKTPNFKIAGGIDGIEIIYPGLLTPETMALIEKCYRFFSRTN